MGGTLYEFIVTYIYIYHDVSANEDPVYMTREREWTSPSIIHMGWFKSRLFFLFYQRKLTYLEFQSRWDIACSFPVTPVHMQCIKLVRFSKWPFRCSACTCWQMRSVGSGNNLKKTCRWYCGVIVKIVMFVLRKTWLQHASTSQYVNSGSFRLKQELFVTPWRTQEKMHWSCEVPGAGPIPAAPQNGTCLPLLSLAEGWHSTGS